MPVAVTITDETAHRRALHTFALDFLTEHVTVREIIRSRVYQEVQEYNARSRATFSGLVQPAAIETALNGERVQQWRVSRCQPLAYSGLGYLIQRLEAQSKSTPLTIGVAAGIQQLVGRLKFLPQGVRLRRQILALERLAPTPGDDLPLQPGEAWSDCARAAIGDLPMPVQRQWRQLLLHCGRAAGPAPALQWRLEACRLRDGIAPLQFQRFFCEWAALAGKPRTVPIPRQQTWGPDPNDLFNDANADVLQGLAWLAGEREDSQIARALAVLALSAYRKVAGKGQRCERVGNVCVRALGAMPGRAGIEQLAVLQTKERSGKVQKAIAKALAAAAAREGLSPEEIEEICMPSCGLTAVGLRAEQIGDFTAVLTVPNLRTAEIK